MSSWKIIGAAVRGPDHEVDGSPCQDAFCHRVEGDRLVATVADGAGSARHSDQGARRLCDVVTAELAACTSPLPKGGEEFGDIAAIWIDRATRAIEMVRDEFLYDIAQAADDDAERRLRDYAATLVVAVAEPDGGFFLHIGDGAGAALPHIGAWSGGVLSKPENGEFANETYFYTGDEWREKLRLTPFGASELIVLLSDGAMPFTLADKLKGLEPRFMAPVTKFLDGADVPTGEQALAQTLNRDDARRISGDDKTLVWIRHQAA